MTLAQTNHWIQKLTLVDQRWLIHVDLITPVKT